MKPIYFLLFACLFFTCSNEKNSTPDNYNSIIQPPKSIPAEEFKPIELKVYIDDFKMRSGPGVEYEEVAMLAVSSPVLVNGFQVGVVSDIYLNPDNMSSIIVILDIDNAVGVGFLACGVL